MRPPLALLLAFSSPAAATPLPALALFADGFPGGSYEVSKGRPATRSERLCLANPERLVFGGKPVGAGCRVRVYRNAPDRATVGWQCAGGDSGLTELRRDHAGLYVASTSGVADGLPFALSAEYRRVGDC
ncbi:hypothetical protein [Thermaurantiacus sp.]